MSNPVVARRNAKFDTFKLLLGPLLGRDATTTIDAMMGKIPTSVQFEPLPHEHSLAVSVPYKKEGARLVVHAQWVDERGAARFLFRKSLPLHDQAAQLLYTTGHESVLGVKVLQGHVQVFAVFKADTVQAIRCGPPGGEEPDAPKLEQIGTNITEHDITLTLFKGYIRAGGFKKTRPFRGFQICLIRI